MPYDGVVADIKTAVELKQPGRIPVFACSEEFDVYWHGKYDYETACQDGDKLAEVWIAAIEEFDYDWAWVQVDDCFEFEPLGVDCPGEGSILRATQGHLPATRETLDSLPAVDPQTAGRMPEKLKAIRQIREHFGDTVLVEGSVAAPYTSCGLLYGIEEAMVMAYTDRGLLFDTCEFFLDMQFRWAEAQVNAGAHAVWLGDCNAYSSMLSLDQYRELAFPSCKKLVERCKQELDAIVHIHNSEEQIAYLLAQTELGVDIVNAGPNVEMADVMAAFDGVCCVSGNLDPLEVLYRGTPEEVASEAERIMRLCRQSGGRLFCTGEMNPRDTPPENMRAMVQAAKAVR